MIALQQRAIIFVTFMFDLKNSFHSIRRFIYAALESQKELKNDIHQQSGDIETKWLSGPHSWECNHSLLTC